MYLQLLEYLILLRLTVTHRTSLMIGSLALHTILAVLAVAQTCLARFFVPFAPGFCTALAVITANAVIILVAYSLLAACFAV